MGDRMIVPKGDTRPRAVDLCCGAGGFAIALQAAGFRHLGFDSWQPAIDTHLANGMDAKLGDVMTMDWSEWAGKVEVIVGGPPCQPFSAAGDGRGEWDERDCIPGFIRAVREVRPEWFVMENVRGLTFKKHRDYLARVIDGLEDAGYRVEWRVLHAEEYGVPQTRQRLIVVGARRDTKRMPRWPVATHRRYRHKVAREDGDQGLLPWVSMADALGWGFDDRPSATVSAGGTDTGGAEVFTNAKYRQRLSDWVHDRPSTTIVGSFRPDIVAAPGYRKKGDTPRQNAPGSVKVSEEEAATLQSFPRVWGAGMTSGTTAGARPRLPGEPIATLTGKGTAYLEHAEGRGRRIMPAEAKILQSFPDGYVFTGNSGTIYKQIGNAIPPLLALAIIEANK